MRANTRVHPQPSVISLAPQTGNGRVAGGEAPTPNRLLASLPPDERRQLLELCERVEVAAGAPLWEVGAAMEHCYFVKSGIVSLVVRHADGFESAAGMVGSEGFVGLAALVSGNVAANAYVVQLPLLGCRIPVAVLRAAMRRSPEVLDGVLRFDQAIKVQIFQTAACNLRHSLQQRLARWLLMAHDRAVGDELSLTQEFLSAMLGSRRASVTLAAHALRASGAIRYHQGHIYVIDRPRLEQISCECYAAVRHHYQQLLGWPER